MPPSMDAPPPLGWVGINAYSRIVFEKPLLSEEQEVADHDEVNDYGYMHDGAVDADRLEEEDLDEDKVGYDEYPQEPPYKEDIQRSPEDALSSEGNQVDQYQVHHEVSYGEEFEGDSEDLTVTAPEHRIAVEH